MSSRALRRLQQEATVIKVSGQGGGEASSEDGEERPGFVRAKSKHKTPLTINPFSVLDGEDGSEHESDRDGDVEEETEEGDRPRDLSGKLSSNHMQSCSGRKKRKRKKSKQHPVIDDAETPDQLDGVEEVDAAIKEVNALLGEVGTGGGGVPSGAMATTISKSLLCVERRFLNAENEMRRIFGSRVVRAEAGRQRAHRRVHHRQTMFATPKDSWPKMDKSGLTMEIAESKDGCQYFIFKHSSDYQKVQFQFLEAVETFDPNAIAAVLHAHPYHIDSLLQLSEVCKMSEDMQMATELLERALYCFESNFHTLFNIAHGNCRLNYSQAENRPFFIALFRHLYYIGRKGCHRTALEFCKLLLSLDPDGDPLCVLLMIDYYALRADQPGYLLALFEQWESKRNLSQLPNFALSIPLALFHASKSAELADANPAGPNGPAPGPASRLAESNSKLQEALVMFPNVLLPLMEKCQVTLDPLVMKHSYFNTWNLNRDPKALQLLLKLFIERSHSLWKEPEVLTWLEENARQVVAKVDAKDALVAECGAKRDLRYVGTPRNIYRHVIMSDFDDVTSTLPRDLCESGIMMYDPLPPLDSVSSYTLPSRGPHPAGAGENPLLLFLRSMLPTFENMADEPLGAGGLPLPPRQRLRAQYAAQQMRGRRAAAAQVQGQREEEPGEAAAGPEGLPGQPLDVQASLNELVGMLQRVLDFLPGRGGREEESDGYDSTTSSGRAEDT